MQKLYDALRRYKIAEERIIYCGTSTGESKTYCAESPSFVRRFFDLYPFLNSAIKIFTDDGNCFMENGEDVLAQMGFKDRIVYAPVFHHYASPNDNSVHGDAKKKWHEMFHDFTDDVTTSIALMSYIDKASKMAGLYFHRNLQFGSPYGSQVVRADVEKVCHSTFTDLSLRRLIAYRMFEGVDGRGSMKNLYQNFHPHWMEFIIKKHRINKKNFFCPILNFRRGIRNFHALQGTAVVELSKNISQGSLRTFRQFFQ